MGELWTSWAMVPIAAAAGFVASPLLVLIVLLLEGGDRPRGVGWLKAAVACALVLAAVAALGVAGSQ